MVFEILHTYMTI